MMPGKIEDFDEIILVYILAKFYEDRNVKCPISLFTHEHLTHGIVFFCLTTFKVKKYFGSSYESQYFTYY